MVVGKKVMPMKTFFTLAFVVALMALVLPAGNLQAATTGADLVLGAVEFATGDLQDVAVLDGRLTLAEGATTGRYLSPVLQTPQPYNAVVPQWLADMPDGSSLILRLRIGPDGVRWDEWQTIAVNDDWMLPEDEELIGQMITVPAADSTYRYVQYAVSFSRYVGQPAAALRQLRLTFIDSTAGPTAEELVAQQAALDAQNPQSPQDGYPKPSVVSRAVWCIDPACNYTSGLEYEPVTHLIVHHTVSSNTSTNWAAVVRAIWYYHTFTRGWGDIGYNYLVDMNGVLYEGHLGGDDVVGTHASGANAGSMALALIGTFTLPDQNPPGILPPAPMRNSAVELFAWKAGQKDIDVFDASHLPDVSWGLPHLMGHRDVYGTTVCPGDQAHGLLPWLRAEVANRIGFVSPHQYVDEMSSAFSKSNSNWYVPPGGCGFNGHAYYTWSTTDPGSSTNWGEWRPPVAQSGQYTIEVYAPYCITGRGETYGATYRITHASGTATVMANHEANVGTWMNLGTFYLNAGTSTVVRLTDLTTTDSGRGVWFDAIRLRPIVAVPAVTLGQPATGSWLTQRNVNFSWQLLNGSAISSLTLQVATDAGFANLVVNQSLSATTTAYNYNFGQDHNLLYWRVVLHTISGGTVISEPASFGIDTAPPTSQVVSIFRWEDGRYAVHWQGSDAGSGVASYNIDYRAEGETTWVPWLTNSAVRTALFNSPDGRVYWFRSQAVDGAGLSEALHASGDISTNQAVLLYRVIMIPQTMR
jgi:hypothetical protein